MDRLFVFGDSWAVNYFAGTSKDRIDLIPHLNSDMVFGFSKEIDYYGHWTDYISHFYDVYNFAEGGCSNEDIIHQLGFLPSFEEGDRIVIIFTHPSRFQWMIESKRKTLINSHLWRDNLTREEKLIYDKQLIDRTDLWLNSDERTHEKKFISKIPIFFEKYNPLLISWSSDMSDEIDCVHLIAKDDGYTTIETESGGKWSDGHLGRFGNYLLYKRIADKLNLDITTVNENNILRQVKKII